MPLDVRGRTRATMENAAGSPAREGRGTPEYSSRLGLWVGTIPHERGMPSKRASSACADSVPALCTHRPSLLPIELISEAVGSACASGRVSSPPGPGGKGARIVQLRGSKSRNKVSVGEPAEGSLSVPEDERARAPLPHARCLAGERNETNERTQGHERTNERTNSVVHEVRPRPRVPVAGRRWRLSGS